MSQFNLDNLTEEQKKKIFELNNLRQSYEIINSQILQTESSQRETESAIAELEKIQPDDTVYKTIGGIFLKSDRNKLLDEKKSQKISLEMRLKTLKQKEERVKNQLETMSKSFQADFQK